MTLSADILAYNRRRLELDEAAPDQDARLLEKTRAGTRLLVYGLMAPGAPNAHVLEPFGGTWQAATFPGYLQKDQSCALGGECPGLAWTPDGDTNAGHLVTSSKLVDAWTYLDAQEGPGIIRILTAATGTDDGDVVSHIYVSTDATRTQMMMIDGMNVHADERAER